MSFRIINALMLSTIVIFGMVTVSMPIAYAQAPAPWQATQTGNCATSTTGILAPFYQVTCNSGLNASGGVNSARAQLPQTIGLIINAVFSLMGLIFVILTIYGGFLWMTARGNSSQVEEAEHLIRNSIIGIIVTFAAFSISWFVLLSIGSAGL